MQKQNKTQTIEKFNETKMEKTNSKKIVEHATTSTPAVCPMDATINPQQCPTGKQLLNCLKSNQTHYFCG
jgi:hypothetical protein